MLFLPLFALLVNCSKEDPFVLEIKSFPNRKNDFSLWQLEQYKGISQMGYIIRTDGKKIIMVDGGSEETTDLVVEYINQLGGKVDYWILTHTHHDHVGVLKEILEKKRNIEINSIIHSKLDLELIGLHEPRSLDYTRNFYERLDVSGINQYIPKLGEELNLDLGVKMNILGVDNPNILVNLINNSSLVFKIESNSKSILFTGDLGVEGGNRILSRNSELLRSTHVQMAHHGQDGVSKEFYEMVSPKVALWPTPTWLWENNLEARGFDSGPWKTLVVKNWMDELNIAQHVVAGIEGTTQID